MSKTILSWALVAMLGTPGLSLAGPLSLDEATRHALIHSPELRAAGSAAAAAEARAKAARGAFLPQLGLRYMARRSDNPLDAFADKLNTRSVDPATDFSSAQALNYPDASTIHATQLSVELPLYTGGRLAAGMRETGQHAEAARLTHDYQRQAVAWRTLQAYRSAQAAAVASRIAAEATEAAREHAETTARLVRQGRIVASDRMTAELNLSAMESQREQAAHRERLALEDLRLVAGLPGDRELVLPPWERLPPPPGAPTGSEARALAHRPDLQASEKQVAAARSRITAARAAFQPQIGVVAADTWYDDNAALDNKSQSIMGVVSLNLFNGGRDWHGLSAARRQAEEAEARRDGARLAVLRDVRASRSRLDEALARRAIAEQGVDKARETVRLVKQRYGEGRTILIDLLMAERMLVEARHEELQATLQSELATAELRFAEGTLPLPDDDRTDAGGRAMHGAVAEAPANP
jgi:outer membrane protein TolC